MKRIIATFILLLISGTFIFAQDEYTRKERRLVNEANRLFTEEKYHEALQKYDEALKLNPSFQYAQYNKALTLLKLASDDNKGTPNDPRKKAQELFSNIGNAKTNPTLAASSFYNLGNMAYNDEDYAQAVKMYKNSLRIDPDNKECRQNLLMAWKKLQEQQNQDDNKDQNKDNQSQDNQDNQQDQDKNQDQQNNNDNNNEKNENNDNNNDKQDEGRGDQPNAPQKPQMSMNAEQLLQTMQNKENETRKKVKPVQPAGRYTDKPW